MMTPDQIIEVVQAFKDGKKLQFRHRHSHIWSNVVGMLIWDFYNFDYRIAPVEDATKLERELAASQSAAITSLTVATAITRYAQHRDLCPAPANDCTCGLDNLLKQLETK